MRFIVLGAGAIGSAVGARLTASGRDVDLVARGAHGEVLATQGLDLRTPTSCERHPVRVVPTYSQLRRTPYDVVVLTTMSHHTAEALATVPTDVPVVSLQNGTRALDVIADRGHPLVAGMVFVPAERRAPGVVALAGVPHPGSFLLGAWRPGPWPAEIARTLADGLSSAGFQASVEPDVVPWIRAKVLMNLGGIVAALCDEAVPDVVAAARAEAEAVWAANGLVWRDVDALMARVGDLSVADVDGLPRVGGSTRHALARGDQLETAALHGPIIEMAARSGLRAPVNRALVRLSRGAATPGALTAFQIRLAVGI